MFSKKNSDLQKSLVKLCDNKKDTKTRFRHLKLILEHGNSSESKKVLSEETEEVFRLFTECFNGLDQSLKLKGQRVSKEEIDNILYSLEKLLLLLPEYIRTNAEHLAILVTILKRCLHPGSTLRLRHDAMRPFLIYYQILRDSCSEDLHLMFGLLVPGLLREPFGDPQKINTIFNGSPPLLNPPAGEKPPDQITRLMFETLLDYSVSQVFRIRWDLSEEYQASFLFIFERFKSVYLTNVFPRIRISTAPFKVDSSTTVTAPVPTDPITQSLQVATTKWMVAFLQSPESLRTDAGYHSHSSRDHENSPECSDVVQQSVGKMSRESSSSGFASAVQNLWHSDHSFHSNAHKPHNIPYPTNVYSLVRDNLLLNPQNAALIHGIFETALQLPVREISVIRRVISVYHSWILLDMKEDSLHHTSAHTGADATDSGSRAASDRPHIFGSQNALKVFCTNSVYTFLPDESGMNSISPASRSQALDDQEDLCKRVVALYRHAITKVPMTLSSWECILSTLLRVLTILMPLDPPKDRLSSLCGRLAVPIFQTVLVAWVKGTMSAVISVKLWDDLTDILSKLTAWDELIIRWEKTLELITKMFATEVFGFPSDIESSEESNRVLEASPLTNEQDKEGTLTGPVNISRPRSNASSDIEHLAAYNPRNSCGPSETSGTDDTSLSDIPEPEELDEERGSTLKAGDNRQRNISGETELRSEEQFSYLAKLLDSSLSSSTPDSLKDRDSLNSPIFYPLIDTDRQRAPSASSWISVMAGGQMQGWSPDSTCALWFRVFGVIGPVNKIRLPTSHKFALQSVNHIVNLLHALHDKDGQVNGVHPGPNGERFDCFVPVSIVVPLLCEVAELPDTYQQSHDLAVQMLLEIAFRAPSAPKVFLAQLLLVVHKSLLSRNQELMETTYNYGGMRLLLSGLPCARLLLEDILHSAEYLLEVRNISLQLSSIQFISSILCYLKTLPSQFDVFSAIGDTLNTRLCLREELEQKFYEIIAYYTNLSCPPLLRISAFYCVGRILVQLLEQERSADLPVIDKFVQTLLSALRHYPNEGASEATEVLFMLSTQAKKIFRLDHEIVVNVVDTVCAALDQMTRDLENGSELTRAFEELFVKLVFCLCEWITCTPSIIPFTAKGEENTSATIRVHIEQVLQKVASLNDPLSRFNNAELTLKVEDARSKGRRGLSDHLVFDRRFSADVGNLNASKPGDEEPVLTRRTTSIFGRPPPDLPKEKEKQTAQVPMLVAKSHPIFDAESRFRTLKLAGTYASRHFTSLLDTLPNLSAWVLPGSSVSEGDGAEPNELQQNETLQIFTIYDTLISVMAVKPSANHLAAEGCDQLSEVQSSFSGYPLTRIIVRDLAGKFSYDVQTLFGTNDVINRLYKTQALMDGVAPSDATILCGKRRTENQFRSSNHKPAESLADVHTIGLAADHTLEIMKYVESTSPDLGLLRNHPVDEPGPPPFGITEEQEAHAVILLRSQDDIIHLHVADMLESQQLWAKPIVAKPYETPQALFAYCSRFLSQLGYTGQSKRQHVHLLNHREETFRDLRLLDKRPNRETHKIAVIYVGRGQEDKSSLMTNDSGSTEYETFVSRLGWKIDVALHTGFRGGLPHNSKQFSEAVYYASATVEILFHVATLIPAISTEDHTAKMRHIGNDEVHIVWSDHSEPYDRSILKTKFADVIICVYPTVIPTLYRIQILQKPNIPSFGPLYDGAIVEESSLAELVRCTASYAGRACRNKLEGYRYFFQERADYLRSLIQSHSLESTTTYESFLTALMSPQLPKTPVSSVPSLDVVSVLRPSWRDSQRRHNDRARQVMHQRRSQGPEDRDVSTKPLQPNFGARYSYPLQLGTNPAATDV